MHIHVCRIKYGYRFCNILCIHFSYNYPCSYRCLCQLTGITTESPGKKQLLAKITFKYSLRDNKIMIKSKRYLC